MFEEHSKKQRWLSLLSECVWGLQPEGVACFEGRHSLVHGTLFAGRRMGLDVCACVRVCVCMCVRLCKSVLLRVLRILKQNCETVTAHPSPCAAVVERQQARVQACLR